MATSTTNYSFTLPEVGGDTDQWGSQLIANWTLADSTIKTIEDSVGDDVTLTGNDYLTISGQAIAVGDVDLTTDVTGTLPVGSGGTGLSALGSANQVLAVNSTADGLEFQTISGSGTVTSVTVTGSDGIEIDSGSPVTTSGTIALGINSTSLSTHLGLGSLATQSTITESQISDLQSYLTAETNDLSAAVTWANVPDANITESSVTQHEAALTITESQISDLGSYQPSDAGLTSISGLTTAADKMLYTTAADTYAVTALTTAGRALLDDADAAAQRTTLGLGSLATQSTITESQISDLQGYLTAETNDLGTAVTGTLGIGNGGTGLTAIGTAGQVLKVNSGATALEFADESGGGGSSSYIEHSSTVTDSLAISAGTNRMYVGNTSFSSGGVTIAGYLVISHGYANFTGASALDVTGTLHVRS